MNEGQGRSDELSSIIAAAHELKAPLALMRQLSLSLGSGSSQQDIERVAHRIQLTSERALRLTTDLTRSSRLQAALFELEPVNPYELCEEVARELRPLFQARGTDIEVESGRRHLLAIANRELLHRVLANFSDNALEYADENATIKLSARQRGAKIRLSVRDYGPAVPAQVWRQLQSSLGKRPQAVQARPNSSGLGLYLAGQFAKAMSGEIGAINHRDGTSFYVDLQSSTQLSLL